MINVITDYGVASVGGQDSSSYYYARDGYTQYNNAQNYLSGAEQTLSITFKTCTLHGLLLYANNQDGSQYFVVGVSNSRIVVEFNLGQGIREVINTSKYC